MMPPTQRRSTSMGPTGRPPITIPAAAPLSATVSKILRGSCRRASTISIAGTTYSVARSTSGKPTPGPFRGLPSTKASSILTRGHPSLGHFSRDRIGVLEGDIRPGRGELDRLFALLLRGEQEIGGFPAVGVGEHDEGLLLTMTGEQGPRQ